MYKNIYSCSRQTYDWKERSFPQNKYVYVNRRLNSTLTEDDDNLSIVGV